MKKLTENIIPIYQLIKKGRIYLPEVSGIYVFWWIGEKQDLLSGNTKISLKGPGGKTVLVKYNDWWEEELPYPCLYIGKSTNIKNRFSQHIKRGTKGRLHIITNHDKINPYTTSCQLRYGIEHVFNKHNNPLEIIYHKVGFSYYSGFQENEVAERFFMEDLLIGKWRPWFNIDSER